MLAAAANVQLVTRLPSAAPAQARLYSDFANWRIFRLFICLHHSITPDRAHITRHGGRLLLRIPVPSWQWQWSHCGLCHHHQLLASSKQPVVKIGISHSPLQQPLHYTPPRWTGGLPEIKIHHPTLLFGGSISQGHSNSWCDSCRCLIYYLQLVTLTLDLIGCNRSWEMISMQLQ